jgi:hypothetical protein
MVVGVTVHPAEAPTPSNVLLLEKLSKFLTRRAPWNLASPEIACRSTPSKSVTWAVVARVKVNVGLPAAAGTSVFWSGAKKVGFGIYSSITRW